MATRPITVNDPPCGTERSYSGLRLARSLLNGQADVRVFPMGDAASCAVAGRKAPQGYCNIGDMLAGVIRRTGELAVCGTCMEACAMAEDRPVEGAARCGMDLPTERTAGVDKLLVF